MSEVSKSKAISAGTTEGQIGEPPEISIGENHEADRTLDPDQMRGRVFDNFRRYGETYVIAHDTYDRPRLSDDVLDRFDDVFGTDAAPSKVESTDPQPPVEDARG